MKFRDDPRIAAMKVNDVDAFNDSMSQMSRLTDMLDLLNVPAAYFYGSADSRLGFPDDPEGDYKNLQEKCLDLGINFKIIDGLFNSQIFS